MMKWEDVLNSEFDCKNILSKEYKTPIGLIHYANNQLSIKKEMILAADNILTDPSAILETKDNKILFVKMFDGEDRKIITVKIDDNVAFINNYPEKLNDILHKSRLVEGELE